MEKVSKYSKDVLIETLSIFKNKVYIYFYDLQPQYFDKVIKHLCEILNIEEFKKIKEEYLIIFCIIDFNELSKLVEEIDLLDTGEFEICEYINKNNIVSELTKSNYIPPFREDNNLKSVYVNKDEGIIQVNL